MISPAASLSYSTPQSRREAYEARPDLFATGDWRSGDNINMSIGQGDVLVTPLESAPDDMVGSRIARLDWGLYAGEAWLARHPAPRAGSLAGSAVIAASGSLAEVEAYRWFAGLGGEPVASATSPLAMADLAAHGVGIALLPRLVASGDRRLTELAFAGLPSSDVWMVARRAAAGRSQVAAFLKWSRRNLKEKPRAER